MILRIHDVLQRVFRLRAGDVYVRTTQVRSSHRGAVVVSMVTSVPGRCNKSVSKPNKDIMGRWHWSSVAQTRFSDSCSLCVLIEAYSLSKWTIKQQIFKVHSKISRNVQLTFEGLQRRDMHRQSLSEFSFRTNDGESKLCLKFEAQ